MKRTRKERLSAGKNEKKVRRNPFYKDVQQHDEEDETLEHVLSFLDLTKDSKLQKKEGQPIVSETVSSQLESIASFLQQTTTNSSLSKQDVSFLLMPWAAKILVFLSAGQKVAESPTAKKDDDISDDLAILWRTMALSLQVVLEGKNDDLAALSTALPQSVLNKLVRFAMTCSINNHAPVITKYAAQSFALLTAHLYRPTFDLYCNTIMVELGSHVENVVTGEDFHCVVVASIHLLRTLQKKEVSSPKKMFQVLASQPVLLSISKVLVSESTDQTVVSTALREILWEAFFSPAKHIEGYLSMKIALPSTEKSKTTETKTKAGGFQCYQWDLVNTVLSLLQDHKMVWSSEVAVCQMVALLVEGFLVQTLVWQKDYRNRSKAPKSDGSLSTLQFRFWGNFIGALLTKLEDRTSEGINDFVPSLLSCLQALLTHDGYHPTYEDKDQLHFLFLKSVSTRVSALVKHSSAALAAMERLIQLNHLVLHDDLTDMIALATVSVEVPKKRIVIVESKEGPSFELTTSGDCFDSLVGTLFDTYHHLRQLDYLVQCLVSSLPTAESLPDAKGKSSIAALQGALKAPEVLRTIAAAVAAAPHGQTQSLFEILNDWLVKEATALISQTDATLVGAVSIVTTLFVLLLRNIRVNEHTSKDILALCEKSLEQSGSILLTPAKEGPSDLAKDGIRLCGWIVDLQNRCAFWSSSPDAVELVSLHHAEALRLVLKELSEDLVNANSSSKSLGVELYKTARYELQFLACYRIQQLHSLIHQKQRDNYSNGLSALSEENELLAEARRLVGFLVASARDSELVPTDEGRDDENPWILLAKFLPAWTPYGGDVHIYQFLEWLFAVNAGLGEYLSLGKESVDTTISPHSKSADAKEAVVAMLRDSCFFENRKVADKFTQCGILYAQLLLEMKDESLSPRILAIGDGEDAQQNFFTKSSSVKANFLSGTEKATAKSNLSKAAKCAYLRGVANILEAIISGSRGSRSCELVDHMLSCLLEMDTSIRFFLSVNSKDPDLTSIGIEILTKCRKLLSAVILESKRSSVQESLSIPTSWGPQFIFAIISSTKDVIRKCCPDSSFQLNLANASSELIKAIGFISIDKEGVTILKQLLFQAVDKADTTWNTVDRTLFRSCAMCVKLAMAETPAVSHDFAEQTLKKLISRASNVSEEEYSSFLLLVGDLLALGGADTPSSGRDLIFEYISSSDPKDCLDEFSYLAGVAINSQTATESVSKKIQDHVLNSRRVGAIEVPMLCNVVSRIPASDFTSFLELTLSTFQDNSKASEMLCALLATTERQDHREASGRFGSRILLESTDSLRSINDYSQVQAAASLVNELIKHKDLVKTKERDIARLLGQTSCLMQDVNSSATNVADVEYFNASCAIVTSLIQRFPKQLYTCVASLTLVLQKIFQFVLHRKQSVNETVEQARAFSRVCGMLPAHKDILKKHILGLILDFVNALRNDLMPDRKNALTPSVYFLLEMLSEYEVNQLNALLDTTGKALFKSFYEGFQKRHVYRGRF